MTFIYSTVFIFGSVGLASAVKLQGHSCSSEEPPRRNTRVTNATARHEDLDATLRRLEAEEELQQFKELCQDAQKFLHHHHGDANAALKESCNCPYTDQWITLVSHFLFSHDADIRILAKDQFSLSRVIDFLFRRELSSSERDKGKYLLQKMLESGYFNPNELPDRHRRVPIAEALWKYVGEDNGLDVVKLLVDHVNPNLPNAYGRYAINYAARYDKKDILKLLVKGGANVTSGFEAFLQYTPNKYFIEEIVNLIEAAELQLDEERELAYKRVRDFGRSDVLKHIIPEEYLSDNYNYYIAGEYLTDNLGCWNYVDQLQHWIGVVENTIDSVKNQLSAVQDEDCETLAVGKDVLNALHAFHERLTTKIKQLPSAARL